MYTFKYLHDIRTTYQEVYLVDCQKKNLDKIWHQIFEGGTLLFKDII